MSNDYKEIGRWKVGTPDGGTEELILEQNKDGFRLKNEFGNVNIELDKMSARELFKNLKAATSDQLEQDLYDWFQADMDNDMDDDMDTDCDNDDNDDHWGAD
jgi:hypothetical protein